MKRTKRTIEDVLTHHLRSAPKEEMEWDAARVLHRLRAQEKVSERAKVTEVAGIPPASTGWRRLAVAGAAATLLTAAVLVVVQLRNNVAVVETHDGTRHRIAADTVVRAEGGTAVVSIKDGSQVEMRTNAELSLKRGSDGMSISLNDGSIIVRAAKQHSGHLYVKTKDALISVVGTVFLVRVESEGSRIAVIEGEVKVQQQDVSTKLQPGEMTLTSPFLSPRPLKEEIAWSGHAAEYAALLQQASLPVRFEVASIKPSPYGGRGPIGTIPSVKTLNSYHQPVQELILYAYDMKDFQLSGGPDWVYNRNIYGRDVYDIVAKAEGDSIPTLLQFRQMMQTLLAERFKLRVRHTTKEVPSYELLIAPKGPKLQEGSRDLEVSPATWTAGRTENSYEARRVPMSSLLMVLSTAAQRPVLDRTGLTGIYAFTLRYADLDANPAATTAPSIFTAVQEQLGLKLEPIKEKFDALVIEQVERPSEN